MGWWTIVELRLYTSNMRKVLILALVLLLLGVEVAPQVMGPETDQGQQPETLGPDDVRNVILFVGDGMGPEHVRAARLFLGRSLVFETFPYRGSMTTDSVDGITDSAASATAMATGHRVRNRVISVALPGDGRPLPTALEMWQVEGKRTGLVTTAAINDATPAAFAAHEQLRYYTARIARDMFEDARPNVLFGGAGGGVSEELASESGYTIVRDLAEMQALDTAQVTHVSGQFGEGPLPPINRERAPLPTLAQMTTTALDVLDDGQEGFFLLVEQEGTDSYSHTNDLALMVDAAIELEGAVNAALDWAEYRNDTLILVTADHETGGLRIVQDNGAGELPEVVWEAGTGHTARPVPLYARGVRAARVGLVDDVVALHPILSPGMLTLDHEAYLALFWGEIGD